MAGDQAINKVSAQFSDLAEAARKAAQELGRLAGAELQAEQASRSLYAQLAGYFQDMVEPLAEVVAGFTKTAEGFTSIANVLPGFKALEPITSLVGKTFSEMSGIAGTMTRGITETTSSLVKLSSTIATTQAAQELASAAGNFLGNTFRGVQVTASYLGGQFSRLAPGVSRFLSQGIQGLTRGLGMLGRAAGAAGQIFVQLVGSLIQIASSLAIAAAALAGNLVAIGAKLVQMGATFVSEMLTLPGRLISGMVGGLSTIGSVLAGPTLGLIQAALNPLNSLQGAIAPFIDALNPALMSQLNTAFANLNAVIGRALVPIMGALIPIVRLFGDALVPVAAAFMPVAEQFAQVMVDLATSILPVFAGILMAMIGPVSTLVTTLGQTAQILFDAFLPVINAVVLVFQGVVESVAPLIPALAGLVAAIVALAMPIINFVVPPLISGLKFLADTILEVINYIRSWMFMAALKFGEAMGVKELPQAVKPQAINPGAAANAATKGSSFESIASLGKNLAASTFATGLTPDAQTAQNTARMAEGIDKLVAGQNKQAGFQGNKPAPGLR